MTLSQSSITMNEEQLLKRISEAFGEKPLATTHMPFGHNSLTYEVTLPDRSIIVRMNAQAEVFKGTAHNLKVLSELGLPVAHIISSDVSKTRYPFAYMILDKIPGRDLRYEMPDMTTAQMTRLATQILSFQRKVATLAPGTAFGYATIGEPGRFSTWWELVQHETLDRQTGSDATLNGWKDQLRQLAREKFMPYFEQVTPKCFLDDVTIKNVIVLNGELQGLVDF